MSTGIPQRSDSEAVAQWLVANRYRLGESRARQAERYGVSGMTVRNWETGTTPSASAWKRVVAVESTLPLHIPQRVAEAILELAEWAISPVMLPKDEPADEEHTKAIEEILASSDPSLANALKALLAQTPKVPKATPSTKAPPRRRGGGRSQFPVVDFGRLRSILDTKGLTMNDLLTHFGITMEQLSAGVVRVTRNSPNPVSFQDIGKWLNTPIPRFITSPNRHAGGADWLALDHSRLTLNRYNLLVFMRMHIFTEETLAEDMGVELQEVEAVCAGRSWALSRWVERAAMAMDIDPGAIAWPTPDPKALDGLEIIFLPGAFRHELFEPAEYVSWEFRIAPDEWAHFFGVDTATLLGWCDGSITPDRQTLENLVASFPHPVKVNKPVLDFWQLTGPKQRVAS